MQLSAMVRNLGPILLVSVFFVANGLNGFTDLVHATEPLWVLLVIMACGLVFAGLSWPLFRDKKRSVLFAFLLQLCFLFSRQAFTPLVKLLTHAAFFFCIVAALIIAWWLIRKARAEGITRLLNYLNLLFLVLTIFELATAAMRTNPPLPDTHPVRIPAWKGSQKPDIHVLMFDEYQGDRGLDSAFHFRNDLAQSLQERGFITASDPHGNYGNTFFSLLSLFSMDTLDSKGQGLKMDKRSVLAANRMLTTRNRFTDYLRHNGYSIHAYSLLDIAGTSPTGPVITATSWTRLQYMRTFPGWFWDELSQYIPHNRIQRLFHSKNARFIRYNNEVAARQRSTEAKAASPRFIFSHFLQPHPPNVLDSLGQERDLYEVTKESRLDNETFRKSYTRYIHFINGRIRSMVDGILAKDPAAVIVVMSDHGARNVMKLDPAVLNIQWAIKLPGNSMVVDESDKELVNTFRIVLNHIAGTGLPMQHTARKVLNH